MQSLPLSFGHSIPQLGFGLWEVADAARVTAEALALGYRLIDGAAIYGNEVGMGQGIRASGLPRIELFVTTKVWNNRQGYDETRKAVTESLDRLQLDRLDLCLIHWPVPAQNKYVETWRALIELRDQGVITAIGTSNFNAEQLDRLSAETGVTPALNQIELHPQLQQPELRAAHAHRGIITQSWTPLGKGRSFTAPAIQAIAKRLGRTPAQIILRWHIELGLSVIPRSSRREGLAENFALFDFALTPQDHAAIAALNTNTRIGPDPATFG
ncbi:MAG: aldo/keto reductase [Paracoccaceae bacterium]